MHLNQGDTTSEHPGAWLEGGRPKNYNPSSKKNRRNLGDGKDGTIKETRIINRIYSSPRGTNSEHRGGYIRTKPKLRRATSGLKRRGPSSKIKMEGNKVRSKQGFIHKGEEHLTSRRPDGQGKQKKPVGKRRRKALSKNPENKDKKIGSPRQGFPVGGGGKGKAQVTEKVRRPLPKPKTL